jgi:hypothetical protein
MRVAVDRMLCKLDVVEDLLPEHVAPSQMQALLHIVLLVFDWLFGLGGTVYSPESALTLALAGEQLRTPAGFYNTSPMDLKSRPFCRGTRPAAEGIPTQCC